MNGVNDWTQPGQIPPWNVMGVPVPGKRARTAALLDGDLGALGLNVPVPRTHAGRLANATVARLMWARKPVKLRWYSPSGAPPYVWRAFAPPSKSMHVIRVAEQVARDKGQGQVQITVHQNPDAPFEEDRWWMEFTPVALQPPPEPPPELGVPASSLAAWGPERWSDFGPPQWRASGASAVPEYGAGGAAHLGATPGGPAPSPPVSELGPSGEEAGRQVAAVVEALRTSGSAAGLKLAASCGSAYEHGARAYIDARTLSEPELAAKLGKLRSKYKSHQAAHAGCPGCHKLDVTMRFLHARLTHVRAAAKRSETPPQAVADRPEVARAGLPKWVGYASLALAAVGLGSAWANRKRRG